MITIDLDRIPLKPGNWVLDIGCGSGRHTAAMVCRESVTVFGMDRDPESLREAGARMADLAGLNFVKGKWVLGAADILRLPFTDGRFDLIVCSEVLEHIREDGSAIREMVRVLRPGGMIAISVPRYGPERICWRLSRTYGNAAGGHIRIYRSKRLRRLAASRGLTAVGRHWAHALHSPYWWIKCLMGEDKDTGPILRLYHRFLVWDILRKPPMIRLLDRLLNPVIGKSLVLYFLKKQTGGPTLRQDGPSRFN